jgi:steroid 5-alpha reductase family enzyme
MNPHLTANARYGRGLSLLICTLVYVLAGAAAYFSYPYLKDYGPIWAALWMDVIATLVVFIASLIFRNASLYDPYWSVAPVPIALFWWALSDFDATDIRKILAFVAVMIWAIRLTLNWARGWSGLDHEDWRYQMLRSKTGVFYPLVNLSGIQLFPTVLVFLGCLPLYYIMALPEGTALGWLDILGFLVSVGGAAMELIADEQLKIFKKKHTDPQAFIDSGLWYYSRHPNYFGEIIFWLGLYLMALSASADYYWTGVGFLAMFLLFQFISIPMMDERMVKKRPAYKPHMKKVSRLVPWFRFKK